MFYYCNLIYLINIENRSFLKLNYSNLMPVFENQVLQMVLKLVCLLSNAKRAWQVEKSNKKTNKLRSPKPETFCLSIYPTLAKTNSNQDGSSVRRD